MPFSGSVLISLLLRGFASAQTSSPIHFHEADRELGLPSGAHDKLPNVAAAIYTIVEGKGIKSSVPLPPLK